MFCSGRRSSRASASTRSSSSGSSRSVTAAFFITQSSMRCRMLRYASLPGQRTAKCEVRRPGKAARELVQPEEPMEEAAVEAMLRAQAKVLEALEDAGVKIKPPP
jgi:hypothetical protein